ncbi:hypothetical protein trd_A0161 (plasmid) [Thermomicrobium roseum DSM 5159]|uniref:Uncharacterized protein n=1 Tax=Thermomicrobium roseum (strain ATCC 27502 / DSM 5159 / P-2) TaxID=309801 RepID=B9L2Z6_THERP|nr:hypothetical protein trd_A0161 [Thermomicrobium roseum DSM 5159]
MGRDPGCLARHRAVGSLDRPVRPSAARPVRAAVRGCPARSRWPGR